MLYIKEHRLKKNFSVSKMAELTGISRRTIQDLEKRSDCLCAATQRIL